MPVHLMEFHFGVNRIRLPLVTVERMQVHFIEFNFGVNRIRLPLVTVE
jgi:hypothetical protein